MKLSLLTLTACAVTLFVVAGCSSKAPATQNTLPTSTTPAPTLQADDVLPTPAGYSYRGNLQPQGQTNPFPSILSSTVMLGNGEVAYRSDIQTANGTTRHNIIYVSEIFNGSLPPSLAVNLTVTITNLPAGFSVTSGSPWSILGSAGTVLSIVISPQVATGDYQFDIGINVNGRDWGSLPCVVHVTG